MKTGDDVFQSEGRESLKGRGLFTVAGMEAFSFILSFCRHEESLSES